jgi:prepilin-type N-terminal cleavage/methylation domain-containing protein
MIRKLAPKIWHRLTGQLLHRRVNPSKGFTLLELLVSLAIGSVIVYLMLFAVVELLRTNQREAARSDTQRDMQAALDYIARDLREAVYVYDGNCLRATRIAACPSNVNHTGLLNYLPLELTGTNPVNVPVLAFWRVDPLPDDLIRTCSIRAAALNPTPPATVPPELLGIPCVSLRMYTLVVYSLRLNQPTDETWKGRARITRYTLPQYLSDTTVAAAGSSTFFTQGWASPIAPKTDFPSWPLDSGLLPAAWSRPAFRQETLVDFVDDRSLAGTNVSCPSNPTGVTNQVYIPTPNNPAVTRRGFYTCINVTTEVSGTIKSNQTNQEVVVYINGNAAGKPGIPRDSNVQLTIPMETRVLTRGALKKERNS